jgi:iron-sulfur cluster repair di-iron protein
VQSAWLTDELQNRFGGTAGRKKVNIDFSQMIRVTQTDAAEKNQPGIALNAVQHNVPAWSMFAMFFILFPLAGNFIKEREEGSMLRLRLISGSQFPVISGKFIFYLVVCLLQLVLMIAHIVDTHHAYLKTELPRLRMLFAKVMRAHGEHHGAMLEPMQKEFLALAAELDAHLQKEETVVFPRIVALDAAARGKQPKPAGTAIDAPLRELMQEHDRAGAILASLNKRSSHYTPPADACPTFIELFASLHRLEEDLHEHVHLENNLLYPQVASLETGKS